MVRNSLVAVLAAGTVAVAAAADRGDPAAPQARIQLISEDLVVGPLVPGGSVSSAVRVENLGTRATVSVRAQVLGEQPGPHGGLLSERLVARLERLGDPALYDGPLAGLERVVLEGLPAGASADYRLVVTLPDTGRPPSGAGGDNAVQGSTVSVALVHTVVAQGSPRAPAAVPAPRTRVVARRTALSEASPHVVAIVTCADACRYGLILEVAGAPRAGGGRVTVSGRLARAGERTVRARVPGRLLRAARREDGRAIAVRLTVHSDEGTGKATASRRMRVARADRVEP